MPGEFVVAGGRRAYRNWHLWSVIVPNGKVATLRLMLVDRANDGAQETELDSSELAAGGHSLQLAIADAAADDQSRVEIRVDAGLEQGRRFTTPRVPIDRTPSVPDRTVVRTGEREVEVLSRPTTSEGVWLVWRLILQ